MKIFVNRSNETGVDKIEYIKHLISTLENAKKNRRLIYFLKTKKFNIPPFVSTLIVVAK